MRVAIYRKSHFCAAHRLHNPDWNEEKNKEIFGKCNNLHYHGHNYELVVKLVGEVNPDTGFLINFYDLKKIIEENVEDRFDHKNLNMDTVEFKNKMPSTENFVVVIYDILRKKIDSDIDIQVRLYETPRNFAEYPVSI